MHRLVSLALWAQIVISGVFTFFGLGDGAFGFYFFLVWQAFIFLQAGLTFGNLTALAMEPMGHIAGMAASVVGAIATVGAVMVSAPIGFADWIGLCAGGDFLRSDGPDGARVAARLGRFCLLRGFLLGDNMLGQIAGDCKAALDLVGIGFPVALNHDLVVLDLASPRWS